MSSFWLIKFGEKGNILRINPKCFILSPWMDLVAFKMESMDEQVYG